MDKKFLILAAVIVAISVTLVVLSLKGNNEVILKDLGLEDLTTEEIVLELDSLTLDGDIYSSSINGNYLTISTSSNSTKLDIPDDKFYLSFAPYLENTHECYTHNLVSCSGELKNQTFDVLKAMEQDIAR